VAQLRHSWGKEAASSNLFSLLLSGGLGPAAVITTMVGNPLVLDGHWDLFLITFRTAASHSGYRT
jgi:hypothetical protein